jgi:hypothetical protein
MSTDLFTCEATTQQGITFTACPPDDIISSFAYLSNSCNQTDIKIHSNTYLNPIDLTYSEFIKIFYSTPDLAFNINPVYIHFAPISLINQKYTSTNGKVYQFNLYDEILKTYSKKTNRPVASIPPHVKIELQREVFGNQTIVTNIGYQSALSWDEILFDLTTTNQICKSNDCHDCVLISFSLQYVFCSSIGINIAVTFRFRVCIPGYVNSPDLCPQPYSACEVNTCNNKLKLNNYCFNSNQSCNSDCTSTINSCNISSLNDELSINEDYEISEYTDDDSTKW